MRKQETLVETLNLLIADGFTADFRAEEKGIKALKVGKLYRPDELRIIQKFRFEGFSNPSDNVELFALRAKDGTKGTLVMTYGAKQSQNTNQIKQLKSYEENNEQTRN